MIIFFAHSPAFITAYKRSCTKLFVFNNLIKRNKDKNNFFILHNTSQLVLCICTAEREETNHFLHGRINYGEINTQKFYLLLCYLAG